MTGGVRAWLLAFVAAAGVGFGALVGIGCALGANACPFGGDTITATTGREIWVEAACRACHGADGAGSPGNPRAPSLVSGSALTLPELIDRIERGSPGLMPRFKSKLTPQQIEAVARYVLTLREAA